MSTGTTGDLISYRQFFSTIQESSSENPESSSANNCFFPFFQKIQKVLGGGGLKKSSENSEKFFSQYRIFIFIFFSENPESSLGWCVWVGGFVCVCGGGDTEKNVVREKCLQGQLGIDFFQIAFFFGKSRKFFSKSRMFVFFPQKIQKVLWQLQKFFIKSRKVLQQIVKGLHQV